MEFIVVLKDADDDGFLSRL